MFSVITIFSCKLLVTVLFSRWWSVDSGWNCWLHRLWSRTWQQH